MGNASAAQAHPLPAAATRAESGSARSRETRAYWIVHYIVHYIVHCIVHYIVHCVVHYMVHSSRERQPELVRS